MFVLNYIFLNIFLKITYSLVFFQLHIYNGILLSRKKEQIPVRWMNLEPVAQSEESQKERGKYHILCIYMESIKMLLMNLFSGKEWRCIYREQTCGHSRGRNERVEGREK